MNTTTQNKIKKGHLYFNVPNARVERITEVREDGSVFSRHHNDSFTASFAGAYRLATREEVMAYLGR